MNIGFKELAELDPEGNYYLNPEYPGLWKDKRDLSGPSLQFGELLQNLSTAGRMGLYDRLELRIVEKRQAQQ